MATLTSPMTMGDVLKEEFSSKNCREVVTLASGTSYLIGAVLGQVTVGAVTGATAAAAAGNTSGSGAMTMADPAFASTAKAGVWHVRCIEPATNGGTFAVEDPDGVVVGVATVGVAYTGDIKFTIADATDFVAGDSFNVTVVRGAASGKYVLSPYALTDGVDGAESACAVLLENRDATDGDLSAVVVRHGPAVVSKAALSYDSTVDDATKRATKWGQLSAAGIIVRDSA